jgi:hypothetical protein
MLRLLLAGRRKVTGSVDPEPQGHMPDMRQRRPTRSRDILPPEFAHRNTNKPSRLRPTRFHNLIVMRTLSISEIS